jgi:hypothetical protein
MSIFLVQFQEDGQTPAGRTTANEKQQPNQQQRSSKMFGRHGSSGHRFVIRWNQNPSSTRHFSHRTLSRAHRLLIMLCMTFFYFLVITPICCSLSQFPLSFFDRTRLRLHLPFHGLDRRLLPHDERCAGPVDCLWMFEGSTSN